MLLQATSPVRLPGTLTRAVRQFVENGKDSMVGVIPMGRSCGDGTRMLNPPPNLR